MNSSENPQPETRSPNEIQNPGARHLRRESSGTPDFEHRPSIDGSLSDFSTRISFGLRISVFGFLIGLTTLNVQLSTLAQGTAFTYQGRLNDGGVPANGTYDFRFKLYVDPVGNTQTGSAALTNGVSVANGLFTTSVDFGAAPFNGSNYWLGIEARTNGASTYANLNPLQPLTPAPYAIFAATAGSVPAAALSGTDTNPVIFSNVGNSFSGDGSGLTGLNASQLANGTVPLAALNNAWKISGNTGTTAGANFIGTSDNQSLELHVNGLRGLRVEPGPDGEGGPNIIAGSPGNYVSNSVVGATIAGGGATNYFSSAESNSVAGDFGTVGGGRDNRADNIEATVSGGAANVASGQDATIGGGYFHNASGAWSTVSGGFGNTASGDEGTVGGGQANTSGGQYATVSGGFGNSASGSQATVPGGHQNIATGTYSFAAGQQAFAGHTGTFVWADSQNAGYLSDRPNQFKVRAAGGVVLDVSGSSGLNPAALFVNSTSTNGVGMYIVETSSDASFVVNNAGSGSIIKGFNGGGNPVFEVLHDGTVNSKGLALTSDRNTKENFNSINPQTVLDKVASLPISEWNYRTDRAEVRHVGPTAQDFHAAFGLDGDDDRHISVVDEGGVALAAIQGLNRKVEDGIRRAQTGRLEAESKSRELEVRTRKLERENDELKQRLAALETFIAGLSHAPSPQSGTRHDATNNFVIDPNGSGVEDRFYGLSYP